MSTPSVYVSRLRRAFLLRTHPDRFRSHSVPVRKQQHELLQQVSDRMGRPDFLSYTLGEGLPTMPPRHYPSLSYLLEHKDGSLHQHNLNLNQNVMAVLQSMANALSKTGFILLPAPPKIQPKSASDRFSAKSNSKIHWASETNDSKTTIDHQYDVNSNHGRDFRYFLNNLDKTEIEHRQQSRMNVMAAAMVVRQRYRFLAVDGTKLGWSSESLARLLQSLMDLHEEFEDKFFVKSFYPLRLVFSSQEDEPLDIYGGILYLNPACTPLQWLDAFQSVTPEALEANRANQAKLQTAISHVAHSLNVNFRKGHSCSSREYFDLLMNLKTQVKVEEQPDETRAIALEPVHVMVESPQACRRSILTKEGHIRMGASMTSDAILLAVSRLAPRARQDLIERRHQNETAKQIQTQVQQEFGLQRVYRSKMVQLEQFVTSLRRVLIHKGEWRRLLAGNSLGIVGSGQFCHLGDDGSLMVPHDWK